MLCKHCRTSILLFRFAGVLKQKKLHFFNHKSRPSGVHGKITKNVPSDARTIRGNERKISYFPYPSESSIPRLFSIFVGPLFSIVPYFRILIRASSSPPSARTSFRWNKPFNPFARPICGPKSGQDHPSTISPLYPELQFSHRPRLTSSLSLTVIVMRIVR